MSSLTGSAAPLSTVVADSRLYKQLIAAISGGGDFELLIIIDGGVKKPPVHVHVALSHSPSARQTAPDFGFLGDIVASLSGGGASLSTGAVNSGLYKQLIAAASIP